MQLVRGFATVGTITIASRILGFVRDILIAAVLGASTVADAFFVAFRIPNMFRRLFAEGAFDSAFIPLFSKRIHADPEAARAFAGQALSGLAVVLVAFTLLGEIAMPWLMFILAPGFASDPEKFAAAVLFARIALPYLVFMSVVALYAGILNAFGRFAIAAFTPTLLNVVLIVVLLAFVAAGGSNQSAAGIALAWGVAASGLLQVLVVAIAAAKIGMLLPWQRPQLSPEMRRLCRGFTRPPPPRCACPGPGIRRASCRPPRPRAPASPPCPSCSCPDRSPPPPRRCHGRRPRRRA